MKKTILSFSSNTVNLKKLNEKKIAMGNYLFGKTGYHGNDIGDDCSFIFSTFYVDKFGNLKIKIISNDDINFEKGEVINLYNEIYLKIDKVCVSDYIYPPDFLKQFKIKSFGGIILRNEELLFGINNNNLFLFYQSIFRNISKKMKIDKTYYFLNEQALIEESFEKINLKILRKNKTQYKNGIYLNSIDFEMEIKDNLSNNLFSFLKTGLTKGFGEKNKLGFGYSEFIL